MLGWGQAKYKASTEHLTAPDGKEALQTQGQGHVAHSRRPEVGDLSTVRHTGLSYEHKINRHASPLT